MTGIKRFTSVFALAALCACHTVTGPVTPSGRDISGRWSYLATASDRAALATGTLDVTRQEGSTIVGVLDAQEADSYGVARAMRGIVGGRVVADSTVEFDVVLTGGRTRRHIGTMAGDSVRGAWIELSDVQVIGSGSFRGRKERP